MKKNLFTEEQIVAILREAGRSTVAEVAKKHKVSAPTICAWRKHFGQLDVADPSGSRPWSLRTAGSRSC